MRVKKKMEKKKGKNISPGWMAVLAVAVVFAVMIPAASAAIESSSAIFSGTDNSTVAAADSNDILNISFVDDTNDTVWANITLPSNDTLVFNNLINVSYVNPSGDADTAATAVSSGAWGVNVTFDNTAAANNLTIVYLNVTARKEGNYSINVATSSTKFSIPITIERGKVRNENTSVYYNTIQGAVDAASAGDTVFVRKGTYHEHVTISKPIILIGEDRNGTIIDGGGSGKCIYVSSDYSIIHDVTIKGFTIQNAEYGVFVDNIRESKILLENCTIKNAAEDGLCFDHCTPSYGLIEAKNNHIKYNNHGIKLDTSKRIKLQNNTINSNEIGIFINPNADDNRLYNNIISDNSWTGISIVHYSSYQEIIGNTIESNGKNGVEIKDGSYYSKIYHNNFINNKAADSCGYNDWDDGYPSGGNYWSDYTGEDKFKGAEQDQPGSDGIGDVPYEIDADSIDHYPLMDPYGVNKPPIASFTYYPENPVVNQTIEFDASASYDLDGSITNYEWDFGDGDNATGEIVTHSYSSPGNYTVSLTVTDDDGATGSTSKTITVAPPPVPPVPTIAITTDKASYSPGDTMNIAIDIDNPTEDSVTFQWYWIVPQFSVCVPVMSASKPAGYNDTSDFNFTIPNWGPKPFGSVFYVHLLDAESDKVLSQDAACWAYVPGGKGKGEILSQEDIAKGIEEGIRGTVFFTAKSAKSAEKSSNSK